MQDQPLLYAIDKDTKKLVFIKDVHANGLACNCICPVCGKPLVAKSRATELLPHFAHENGSMCSGANESVLHLLAKEIILNENMIMTPAFNGGFVISNSQQIHFHHVDEEFSIYNLRPDLIGYAQTKDENGNSTLLPLWIEILVTHKVDGDKIKIIKEKQVACIEINLQQFLGKPISKQAIKDFMINSSANRIWINNPKLQNANIKEKQRLEAVNKDCALSALLTNLQPFIKNTVAKAITGSHSYAEIYKDCLQFDYTTEIFHEITEQIAKYIHNLIFQPDKCKIKHYKQAAKLLDSEDHPSLIAAINHRPIIHFILEVVTDSNRRSLQTSVIRKLFENNCTVLQQDIPDILPRIKYMASQLKLNIEESLYLEQLIRILYYKSIYLSKHPQQIAMFNLLRSYPKEQLLFAIDSLYLEHIIGMKSQDCQISHIYKTFMKIPIIGIVFKQIIKRKQVDYVQAQVINLISTKYKPYSHLLLPMAKYKKIPSKLYKEFENIDLSVMFKPSLLGEILHILHPDIYVSNTQSTMSKHYSRFYRNW